MSSCCCTEPLVPLFPSSFHRETKRPFIKTEAAEGGEGEGVRESQRKGRRRGQTVGRRSQEGAEEAAGLSKTDDGGASAKGAAEIQIFVAGLARQRDSAAVFY